MADADKFFYIMSDINSFAFDNFFYLALIGVLAQGFLANRKLALCGWLFALSAFISAMYWMGNPLPSSQVNTPTMTGMNAGIIWLPLTLIFLVSQIIFLILNRKHKNNVSPANNNTEK